MKQKENSDKYVKTSELEASRSKWELQDLMHNRKDENQNRIFNAYFEDLIVNSIKRERKSLTSMVFGSIKIDHKEKKKNFGRLNYHPKKTFEIRHFHALNKISPFAHAPTKCTYVIHN